LDPPLHIASPPEDDPYQIENNSLTQEEEI